MSEVDQERVDSAEEKPGRGLWAALGSLGRKAESREAGSDPEAEDAPTLHTSTRVGQLLWETREARRLTLEQVENEIRIRPKYLAALETGKYDELPTPGHIHGFLRNYAIFLELDWQEVEAMYAQEQPHRHFDPGIFHPKDIVLSPRRFSFKVDLVLGLVILLVIAVLGGWAFWEYGRPLLYPSLASTSAPTVTPASITSTVRAKTATRVSATATRPRVTATPKATQANVPTPTPTEVAPTATATLNAPLPIATPTPPPTETPSPTPTRAEGVELSITVIERAWLQVTLDGEDQPGGILEAGEEREWKANDSIYLICGNAGGIKVVVNGQDLGVLGERAQVVEKMWTPQGEATPTPAPEGGDAATPTIEPTPTPAE